MILLLIYLFVTIFFLILLGWLEARKYRKTGYAKHFHRHRILMTVGFYITVLFGLLIELSIDVGIIKRHSEFLWVHVPFAFVFFVLFALQVFWRKGSRLYPHLHRRIGYVCLTAFVGTVATSSLFLMMV